MSAAGDVTARAVWLAINENVGWDDRKTLLDIWQEHAPLPETGLNDGIYEALLAVARWGAQQVAEDLATPDATARAKAEADAEPCDAETWSWWHFSQEQVDGYWIRCTLAGPHDEHEDANTGLTRTARADRIDPEEKR